MPQILADLIDKMPLSQLKTIMIVLSAFIVTGGSAYVDLSAQQEQLRQEARQRSMRLERETDRRFDEIEKREAETAVLLRAIAEQIKDMHSIIYRPIGDG